MATTLSASVTTQSSNPIPVPYHINVGDSVSIAWNINPNSEVYPPCQVDSITIIGGPSPVVIQNPANIDSYTIYPNATTAYSVYAGLTNGLGWQSTATQYIGFSHLDGAGAMGDWCGAIVATTPIVYVDDGLMVTPQPPGIYYPNINPNWTDACPQIWAPSLFNPYTGTYAIGNASVALVSDGAGSYKYNTNKTTNLLVECSIDSHHSGSPLVSYPCGISRIATAVGATTTLFSNGTTYYAPYVASSGGLGNYAFYAGATPIYGTLNIGWWGSGLLYVNTVDTAYSLPESCFDLVTTQHTSAYLTPITTSIGLSFKTILPCSVNITGNMSLFGIDSADGGSAQGTVRLIIDVIRGIGSAGSGPYATWFSGQTSGNACSMVCNGTSEFYNYTTSDFSLDFSELSNLSLGIGDTINIQVLAWNDGGLFCVTNNIGGLCLTLTPLIS